MIDRPGNINVFLLYAAEDEELKSELESHLSLLHRHGLIDVWHEGQIVAGAERDEVVSEYLDKSHIILLLISSNFLAPDCYGRYEQELRKAYERQTKKEVIIIPVILRHCMWKMDMLGSLIPLPKDGHPVRSSYWESSDLAYQNIALGLQQIANDLLQTTSQLAEVQQSFKEAPAVVEKPDSQPTYSSHLQRDQIAKQLINNLFSLFQTLDKNTCAKMAIPVVHKSLVKFQEMEKNFLHYKFLKAYDNATLYQYPIKMVGVKETGRKSMGIRDQKEKGEEVMYEISRKKDIGALPGHVRIFFPADGGLAKISNLSV